MARVETFGSATLYLGDCREIVPTIGRVSAVICDPPYSELVHATRGRRGKSLRKDGGPSLASLDFASIGKVHGEIARMVGSVCDGWFLYFSDVFSIPPWRDAVIASGGKSKTVCVWVKPDSAPQFNGQKPAMAFEMIGVAWYGRGISSWNGRGRRGVFTYPTNGGERTGKHDTEKPVGLMAELVTLFANPGQTVLDPFMGSGTTGVACMRHGRAFVGVEINPVYFDLACRRMDLESRSPGFLPDIVATQEPFPWPDDTATKPKGARKPARGRRGALDTIKAPMAAPGSDGH